MQIQQKYTGFPVSYIYDCMCPTAGSIWKFLCVLIGKVGFSVYYELKNKTKILESYSTLWARRSCRLQVRLLQVNLLLPKMGSPTCFFPCPVSQLSGMNPKECAGSIICPVTGQSIAACCLCGKTVWVFVVLSGFPNGLEGWAGPVMFWSNMLMDGEESDFFLSTAARC